MPPLVNGAQETPVILLRGNFSGRLGNLQRMLCFFWWALHSFLVSNMLENQNIRSAFFL